MHEAAPLSPIGPGTAPRTCRSCGTSVPHNEPICSICSRAEAPAGSGWQTFRHWIVLLLMMAALLAGGLYFTPG